MFEDWTIDELKAARKALEKALITGATQVSYNGQTVSYASRNDIRARIADLNSAIAEREGSSVTKPKTVVLAVKPGKGW